MIENEFKMSSAEIETSVSEIPTLVGPKLDAKIEELADKTIAQMEGGLFKTIADSCDRGRVAHLSRVSFQSSRPGCPTLCAGCPILL
jgi:hypothetical protein